MAEATRVQEGVSIDYTPGADVAAGQVVVQNGTVGVAAVPIASGYLGAIEVEGVFDFAKGSTAFAWGDNAYWDDANNQATPTNTGVRLGKCVKAAVSGDATARVKLANAGTGRVATATVAATGSTQADAAAVLEGFTLVTAADATKGVLLPSAAPGMVVEIKNADAANAVLKIWPATSDAVNALSANAAFSIAAKTSVRLVAYDATTWYSIPLLPS